MKVIDAIQAALAKASFVSPDIAPALDTLLDSHKNDLADVGYEASTDTEDAIKGVNAALDAVDTEVENRRADLQESAALAREQDDESR